MTHGIPILDRISRPFSRPTARPSKREAEVSPVDAYAERSRSVGSWAQPGSGVELPDWERRALLNGSQREARVHSGHAGQAGELLAVNSFEILGIRDNDPEQVVKLTGHQVAVHYLGQRPNGLFKDPKLVLILAFECDAHKDNARESNLLGIHPGRVALDDALAFQGSDAPQAGGFREVDPLGQLDVGNASLLLKHSNQISIERIHWKQDYTTLVIYKDRNRLVRSISRRFCKKKSLQME